MTTQTAPTLTPLIIGQAENAHKPLMDPVLAPTGTTFPQWVAMKLAQVAGGAIEREQLVARIAGALKVDGQVAQSAIAELTTAGLMSTGDGSTVALTNAGNARQHQLQAAIDQTVARVYRDIPAEDLATAARVLTQITAQANAEAAA